MKPAVIISCAALAFVAFASAAFSKTAYFIELGSEPSEQEAMRQWQTLVAADKDMLGSLQLHPKTMVEPGNRAMTRVQAGPIDSKTTADKLCSRLFSRNVACFVLEGQLASPPAAIAPSTDTASPTSNAITVSAPPATAGAPLPWLVQNPAAQQGNVSVAEAIRVPLSNNNAPAPVAEPSFATSPATVGQNSDVSAALPDKDYGWLNVDTFTDEESAAAFWQDVRAHMPARAAGLRVRIVRPLLETQRRITVNIGPFPNMEEANNFCRDGVVPVNGLLRCSFVIGEPTRIANAPELHYTPNRDYAARRKFITQMHNVNTASAEPARAGQSARMYWVQVGSASSQMEALHLWKDIQSSNADLLEGMGSRVSTALTTSTTYSVRVGPLKTNDQAMGLCTALRERSVDCKVYISL